MNQHPDTAYMGYWRERALAYEKDRDHWKDRAEFFESQKDYYGRIKRMTAAINAVLGNEGEFLSAEAIHDLEAALSPTIESRGSEND